MTEQAEGDISLAAIGFPHVKDIVVYFDGVNTFPSGEKAALYNKHGDGRTIDLVVDKETAIPNGHIDTAKLTEIATAIIPLHDPYKAGRCVYWPSLREEVD